MSLMEYKICQKYRVGAFYVGSLLTAVYFANIITLSNKAPWVESKFGFGATWNLIQYPNSSKKKIQL